MESDMFERVKRGDDTTESPDTNRTESDKSFGSLRSKVTGRGGDVAVIGRSIQINGDLRGDEDLRIEGDVSGTVELRNSVLTIGKEGKVKAGVYAKAIAVDGETKGDLYATERVSIHVNARVQGNIIAPRVSIEEGAHFKGSIEMDPAAIEKALGKTTTSSTVKSVAQNKAGNVADTKAAPKSNVKDASASANPPAKSA
jgi:cytoskeletal protein CcmA (bactofilin family)